MSVNCWLGANGLTYVFIWLTVSVPDVHFQLINGGVRLVDLKTRDGNPVIITDAWYSKIMVENKPSLFVTKMSYATVGYDHLRTCYIRDSENNLYPNPYPRIRILIFKFFKKFLLEKGYVGNPLATQIGSYSTYLGYSCTYARKRYNRKMLKSNGPGESLIEQLLSW